MKLRLTGTLVLVLGIAALASASAYAGNGNGNGNDNGKGGSPAAAAGTATDHGNSANAPGHQQADATQVPPPSTTVADTNSTTAQEGVKPANDTAHDTHADASSNETKLYGNGKTAGQIAIQNGAAGTTRLHGPGNSQPHKTLCGGHEVDVHALAHKLSKCGTTAPAKPAVVTPSAVTPSAVTPSAPTVTKTAVVTVTATSPAVVAAATSHVTTPAKPAKHAKPAQAVAAGGVKGAHMTLKPKATPAPAGGVLGTSTRLGSPASSSTLPFTGLPLWIFALVAASLLGVGLATRHASRDRI